MIPLSGKTVHAGVFIHTACTTHNLSLVRNRPVFSPTRAVLPDVQARGHGARAFMGNLRRWSDDQMCVKCGNWYIAEELIDDNGKCPTCKRKIKQAKDRANITLESLLYAYHDLCAGRTGDEGSESFVYFIRGKTTRRIKIGYTSRTVWDRLRDHQVGSPDVLEVVGVINAPQYFETALHRILEPYRSHGEWFDASAVIMKFIRKVAFMPSRETKKPYIPADFNDEAG